MTAEVEGTWGKPGHTMLKYTHCIYRPVNQEPNQIGEQSRKMIVQSSNLSMNFKSHNSRNKADEPNIRRPGFCSEGCCYPALQLGSFIFLKSRLWALDSEAERQHSKIENAIKRGLKQPAEVI